MYSILKMNTYGLQQRMLTCTQFNKVRTGLSFYLDETCIQNENCIHIY